MPYEGAWRTGVAQGREDERERIIKLLEQEVANRPTDYKWLADHFIALIKGEK